MDDHAVRISTRNTQSTLTSSTVKINLPIQCSPSLDIFDRFFTAGLPRFSITQHEEAIIKMQNCQEDLVLLLKKLRYKTKHSQSCKGTTNPMVAILHFIGIFAKYHFLIMYYYLLIDYTLFTQMDVPKITNKGRKF